MTTNKLLLSTAFALLVLASFAAAAPPPAPQDLFVGGQGGYHTYRIPAMVVSSRGTVLAFCEGRKTSRADHGDIDLLLRRSFDGGSSWQPVQLVHEEGDTEKITIGNPCPIAAADGTIHLLFSRNNAGAFYCRSGDDGATFSTPVEITDALRGFDFAWTRLGTGPVHGIQIRGGRLVAPLWLNVKIGVDYRSAAAYSDDGGKTWKPGGVIPPTVKDCNECSVVEMADGRLLMNMRHRQAKCRAVAVSKDRGQTWSEARLVPELVDPTCQGSVLHVPAAAASPSCWLFSNAASRKRNQLTIHVSLDEGATWSPAAVVAPGPAAYSDLAVARDNTILCLYECGERDANQKICLARLGLQTLIEAHGKPERP